MAAAPQTRPASAGPATKPTIAAAATRPAAVAAAASAPGTTWNNNAPSDADRLLSVARLYLDNHLYPKAREKLREVIQKHPGTPAAEQAKKLLNDIKDK